MQSINKHQCVQAAKFSKKSLNFAKSGKISMKNRFFGKIPTIFGKM